MNLKDLKKEIPYKWRTGPGNTQLAYIDARDVMDLLDEVVGPENWQDSYELVGDKIIAGVGILANDQWVWKYDTGTESNIEEEKGMFSDAFKRAAVKWGVGRFLYDLKPKKEWNSLSYTHAKEKAKEEIDDLVLTEEMLGGEEEVEKINICPVCAGHISQKEIDYCKSKKIPIACFECQRGKTISSQIKSKVEKEKK